MQVSVLEGFRYQVYDEEKDDQAQVNPDGREDPHPFPGDDSTEFKYDEHNGEQSGETDARPRAFFRHIFYVFDDYVANIPKNIYPNSPDALFRKFPIRVSDIINPPVFGVVGPPPGPVFIRKSLHRAVHLDVCGDSPQFDDTFFVHVEKDFF